MAEKAVQPQEGLERFTFKKVLGAHLREQRPRLSKELLTANGQFGWGMKVKLIVLLALLLLAGCQTKYQNMGFTGGVAAAPIGGDMYRISARGNGYTDPTTVQDYVLLKAAETTLQSGHTHFVIVGGQDASRQEFGQTPGMMQTNIIGNTAYTTYTPGSTYQIVKPGQDVLIKVGNLTGLNNIGAFDAKQVFDAINPRVVRPDPKS
ncbi:hypothetical protein FJW05_11400 [Mesorhizobium sp. B2-9-1]|uniref:CC0125/CC1285 family lipoprotein n=1 Tax=unclassified Mesorhizobium TaxID=325217 RepID=UPI00112AF631|nr:MULTISPECIES: hypothetical protein [unclassified Mesorhizobium]TPI47565.1 hypothetical protein FJW05_11400 [Mesorhizobium sp. B2-9-1]TPJ21708.1 hypothetical protein FJ425_25040 [Mesorhizobium sp. B2-7-2]